MILDLVIHAGMIHIAHAAAEAVAETANPGVAAMFGLNTKLFLAQLINFGIVLFVLWKWAFPPIVKALEARSRKIEQSLEDARSIAKEKQDFQVWKNAEMYNARKEASEIISKAKTDAEAVKIELLTKTRDEQNRIVAQTKERLQAEQARTMAEIKQEAATLVVAVSQKILGKKLDSQTDKELIKESLKQVVK